MSVCTHNLYHGPPHRAPAGRPSFEMGDTQQIDPANVQAPYPRPAGHPRIHLTPIAPVVAFREDIRRVRNVLKSASGADSPRIGALGIYGGSRHTLDAT